MVLFPEKEKPQVPETGEIPKASEVPPFIEKGGVANQPQPLSPVPANPQPPLQTPTNDSAVLVPQNPEMLIKESKGSITDSLTWWASFWLRIVKKASYLGSRIIFGKQNDTA